MIYLIKTITEAVCQLFYRVAFRKKFRKIIREILLMESFFIESEISRNVLVRIYQRKKSSSSFEYFVPFQAPI